jgi:hypothetical protein
MPTKKIAVDGVGRVKLSNDNEPDKWLIKKEVDCLVDSKGYEIAGFVNPLRMVASTSHWVLLTVSRSKSEQKWHDTDDIQKVWSQVQGDALTLTRDHLVLRILNLASEKELVLLNGGRQLLASQV